MGRNMPDFNKDRFNIPYQGEELFHGSPETMDIGSIIAPKRAEEDKGINVPVAWATTSHQDAAAQGGYHESGKATIYKVEPVNPDETKGIIHGKLFPGQTEFTKHFISKHGFKIIGVHKPE